MNIIKTSPNLRFHNFTDEWENCKVRRLLKERNIKSSKSNEYPLMSFVANKGVVSKGKKYNREFLVKDKQEKKYKQTEYGDFIYSSNNLTSGSIGLNTYGKACISPVYSIFYPTNLTTYKFINYLLIRNSFINKMIKYRQGVVYGQWRIYESDFLNINIKIPSLDEQKKIEYFLSTIDKKIELQEEKINKLELHKKGIVQKIFNREIIFKCDNGEEYRPVEKQKLGNMISKTSIRNKDNLINDILSVTNKSGFVLQSDHFSKRIASKDVSNYKKIFKNEFAYNPSRINVGSIALLDSFESGLLSPLYITFKTKKEILPEYLNFYISTHKFKEGIKKYLIGSVRQTLSFEDMCLLKIDLPSIEEQKKIVAFIEILNNKIQKEYDLEYKLNELKRGLLQQMFI